MKPLIALTLCILTFTTTAAHADFRDHGDRDFRRHQPMVSCAELQGNVDRAQANLNFATMNLGNIAGICGQNMGCVFMVQTAYNQAVAGVQQAQAQAQRMQDAQASVNNAQAMVNLATANLMNLGNFCRNGDMGCVFLYQNAYNQSLANLQRSQEILHSICY
jgi:hypothetical protein